GIFRFPSVNRLAPARNAGLACTEVGGSRTRRLSEWEPSASPSLSIGSPRRGTPGSPIRRSAARGLAASASGNLPISPSLSIGSPREERRARLSGGQRLEDSPPRRVGIFRFPLSVDPLAPARNAGLACTEVALSRTRALSATGPEPRVPRTCRRRASSPL